MVAQLISDGERNPGQQQMQQCSWLSFSQHEKRAGHRQETGDRHEVEERRHRQFIRMAFVRAIADIETFDRERRPQT